MKVSAAGLALLLISASFSQTFFGPDSTNSDGSESSVITSPAAVVPSQPSCLSQRKAARSVPIPKTPGSEATCKSWSRTEPSRVARVAAVTDKSRYPELQPWSKTLGQQELQEHLQASPRDCWKGTTLSSGLLLILGLHGPAFSLIPLPQPQAHGTAPWLLYCLKLFKKSSYGAVSPFFSVDDDIIYMGVTGRIFIGG